MKRFLHDNGLSIVMFGLCFVFLAAQSFVGHLEYNQDQQEHGGSEVGYIEYLGTGHFVEAVGENWESEFLQMSAYIFLTAFLFQRGSSESKDPDKKELVDEDPREVKGREREKAPWPVRRGGWVLKLYENSLGTAFALMFIISFAFHAIGGSIEYSQEQLEHGQQAVSVLQYIGTSRFWFESFQNWQSEFLAVGAIVVLSIFLRQKGSPESKPVASPHLQTGE